ncbi:sensor histidine kinase [Rhodoferax sp.]|uniref:sensor histidine kinase n=1 Tax=Rhodoferax sp. TaxID=50421 RepID=UPI0027614C1F|nr:histidine kinase [Rhodoferax sp.]
MKDTQILSAFADLSVPPTARPADSALVFDACHVGVVLRAVFVVEAVVAVAAMFMAGSPVEWLVRLSLLTGGTLPATLLWLISACSLKNVLARLPSRVQYLAGAALGAVAGLFCAAVLWLVGLLESAPWVASAFSGLLLASALVAALVLRARGQMPAATAARLSELQARIRPHFLFNTLNSAIALVRAEPAKAETLLEDLSDLFRHALVDHGESVTLAEEITLARRYLDIEAVRFGERLRVEWSLDSSAEKARLPPMLLQPLVENAVKHGVEPCPSGADIRISTQRRGSTVVIKVTNTVPAGSGEPGNGVALSNVRDRLSLLHDVQGQFQSALKNGVYQVRIEVPL